MIHPTAIVGREVELAGAVEIGPYSLIIGKVRIGEGTVIQSQVRIEGETEIGKNNQIYPGAVLGSSPQHSKYQGEKTVLRIGDGNIIREYVTIHRGTGLGGGVTSVGDGNFLMAYCHLGHDCRVGSRVIMANSSQISGHVLIEDEAVFSGLIGVHQFVRIGQLAMIGGGAMVVMDIPPFAIANGDRARLYGINRIGLKRKGLSGETIRAIQKAYEILFRSGLRREEAVQKVEKEISPSQPGGKEVRHILEFIRGSERGITRFRPSRKESNSSEDSDSE